MRLEPLYELMLWFPWVLVCFAREQKKLLLRVGVVLQRTVCNDFVCQFDNLSGSRHSDDDFLLRLLKCHTVSSQTVLLSATLTRAIIPHWLIWNYIIIIFTHCVHTPTNCKFSCFLVLVLLVSCLENTKWRHLMPHGVSKMWAVNRFTILQL